MLRQAGPRFLLYVVFIGAVAAAAALSHLSTGGIVVVMGATWVLVATLEWAVSRAVATAGDEATDEGEDPTRVRPARFGAAPPVAPEVGAVAVLPSRHEPAPEQPAAPPPEPEPAPEPAAVEESGVPPEVPPPAAVPEEPPGEPVAAGGDDGSELRPTLEAPQAEPEEPTPAEPAPAAAESPQPQPPVAPPPAPARPPVPVAPTGAEPREWNLWDLERLTRDAAGRDAFKDEERSYLLMYLREFANADGILPADFDGLIRDSFGDLVGVG